MWSRSHADSQQHLEFQIDVHAAPIIFNIFYNMADTNKISKAILVFSGFKNHCNDFQER